MASDYEFVSYHRGFKPQIIELQTHLWSRNLSLNAAYFEWKYEHNPYLAEPLVYLAVHKGQVVGMRGFFGVQWEAGTPSQKVPGLYADDLVIHPDHRNRGLVSGIMGAAFKELARRGYDYVFNLSAGPLTLLSSLSLGWRSAGMMQAMRWRPWSLAGQAALRRVLYRLPVRLQHLSRVLTEWPQTRGRPLAAIDMEGPGKAAIASPRITLEKVPRPAAMAELIQRMGSSGRIRHVRDRAYFDWRFQNPLSRYRFLFWAQTRMEGYLVLQEYTSDLADRQVVNIVDWEGSSSAARAELLGAALKLPRHRRLIIWADTLPPETITLLRARGFWFPKETHGFAKRGTAVLVRPVAADRLAGDWSVAGRPVLDLANWDLRMLYSMRG